MNLSENPEAVEAALVSLFPDDSNARHSWRPQISALLTAIEPFTREEPCKRCGGKEWVYTGDRLQTEPCPDCTELLNDSPSNENKPDPKEADVNSQSDGRFWVGVDAGVPSPRGAGGTGLRISASVDSSPQPDEEPIPAPEGSEDEGPWEKLAREGGIR